MREQHGLAQQHFMRQQLGLAQQYAMRQQLGLASNIPHVSNLDRSSNIPCVSNLDLTSNIPCVSNLDSPATFHARATWIGPATVHASATWLACGGSVVVALHVEHQKGCHKRVRGLIFRCFCGGKIIFIFQCKNDSYEIVPKPLFLLARDIFKCIAFRLSVFFDGPEGY